MFHPIDPKIDCLFKALLGAMDNRALLIPFPNATHAVKTEEQRWLKFFKVGERLDVGRPRTGCRQMRSGKRALAEQLDR